MDDHIHLVTFGASLHIEGGKPTAGKAEQLPHLLVSRQLSEGVISDKSLRSLSKLQLKDVVLCLNRRCKVQMEVLQGF